MSKVNTVLESECRLTVKAKINNGAAHKVPVSKLRLIIQSQNLKFRDVSQHGCLFSKTYFVKVNGKFRNLKINLKHCLNIQGYLHNVHGPGKLYDTRLGDTKFQF